VPTTRKLVDLFRALAAEDVSGARALADQIAKVEERKGHRSAARQLRGALHSNAVAASPSGPLVHERANILSAALVQLTQKTSFGDITLQPSVRAELVNIVQEWKQRARLTQHGIHPRSKLLFHGPPGCGKSLTAQALGRELGLPIYMVRFDAVIGAFLGQTAIHLRQLFHFAETTPCVLLLDELDALGKRRGNPLDVGELDRIVISLMQELEHSRPMGIIVGTSNLPKHLDDALWRRFDLEVAFKAPTPAILRSFARATAKKLKLNVRAGILSRATKASSFAAAEAVLVGELRRQILGAPRGKK
jgi:AAA+ superfamily predicted ATPase